MLVDRYLVREVSLPFIEVSAALLAIFLTYSITSFLAKASGGLLNPAEIAHFTFLKSVIALEVLVPLALYLGIILGLGRLYSDSEIYALQAAGIGEGRLLRPIIIFATIMAILVSLLSTVVRPWAYREAFDIRAAATAGSELERIKPGQFYVDGDSGRTVFIQSMSEDRSQLEGIFVRTRDSRGIQVASSATGFVELTEVADYQKMVLVDAHVYRSIDDGPNILGRFKSLTIYLRVADPELIGYRVKTQSTLDLRDRENPEDKAEYQWRLSTSLSTLLLVLMAVPLSRSLPRRGRYAKIMIALLVYALYQNLLVMAKTWVEQEVVSTIWWVPGMLALTVVAIYHPWRILTRRLAANKSYVTD
jgi:lipopolysaccharide export system permease protein